MRILKFKNAGGGPWSTDQAANLRDVVAVLCVVTIGSLLTSLGGAEAATAKKGNYSILSVGNDRFYNYDHLGESAKRTNVDWPLTVVFINNATIDKTKSKVESWSEEFDGSSTNGMHLLMSNNSGDTWKWDKDKGKKTPSCPGTKLPGRDYSPHYRVYATENGGRESLYNTTWGYWNVASTHRDWYECGGNTRFEYPEAVENLLINEVDEDTTVSRDKWWFYNQEPHREEGNHIWSGNGYASSVKIP